MKRSRVLSIDQIDSLTRPEERVKELGTRFEVAVKGRFQVSHQKQINTVIKRNKRIFTDFPGLNHARHTRNCIVHGDPVTDQQINEAENAYRRAIDDLCRPAERLVAAPARFAGPARMSSITLCPVCDGTI